MSLFQPHTNENSSNGKRWVRPQNPVKSREHFYSLFLSLLKKRCLHARERVPGASEGFHEGGVVKAVDVGKSREIMSVVGMINGDERRNPFVDANGGRGGNIRRSSLHRLEIWVRSMGD